MFRSRPSTTAGLRRQVPRNHWFVRDTKTGLFWLTGSGRKPLADHACRAGFNPYGPLRPEALEEILARHWAELAEQASVP